MLNFSTLLTQSKNNWILSAKSIEESINSKINSMINTLREKLEVIFDYESYVKYQIMSSLTLKNYNINQDILTKTDYIGEDTLIFSLVSSGTFLYGIGLFSELSSPQNDVKIYFFQEDTTEQLSKIESNWTFTTYNNEKSEKKGTLIKLDKIMELMKNRKYIITITMNKEVLYSSPSKFSAPQNQQSLFYFYEIEGEIMLKHGTVSDSETNLTN